jgi:hypothetical protein
MKNAESKKAAGSEPAACVFGAEKGAKLFDKF